MSEEFIDVIPPWAYDPRRDFQPVAGGGSGAIPTDPNVPMTPEQIQQSEDWGRQVVQQAGTTAPAPLPNTGMPAPNAREIAAEAEIAGRAIQSPRPQVPLAYGNIDERGRVTKTPAKPTPRPVPEAAKQKVAPVKAVWRKLTPWREEEGETFVSYVKERYTSKQPPSQEQLQAQLDTYQASPTWAKMLFGSPGVAKMKDGTLVQLVAGEAPPVGGAFISKAEQAAQLARKTTLLKTVEINWNKLVPPKTKPGVNWNEIVKAIENGKGYQAAKEASEGLGKARVDISRVASTGEMDVQTWNMLKAREESFRAAVEAYEDAIAASKTAATAGSKTKGAAEIFARAKMNEAQIKLAAARSFANIPPMGYVYGQGLTASVATNPVETIMGLGKLPPDELVEALAHLPPNVRQDIQRGDLAKAQKDAITDLNGQVGLNQITSQAVKEVVKDASETDTETETITSVYEKVKERTDTGQGTEPDKSTQPEPSPEDKTKEKTPTPSDAPPKTPPSIFTPFPTPEPPGERKPPDKGHPPSPGETDEEKRRAIAEADTKVTWQQGELDGKPVHHVVYGKNGEYKKTTVLGAAPKGAIVAKGKGQSYQTVTVARGIPPSRPVMFEGGAVDPVVSPTREGRGVTIRFVKDTSVKKQKPMFSINRRTKGSGRAFDLGADIVSDRRGRHLKL